MDQRKSYSDFTRACMNVWYLLRPHEKKKKEKKIRKGHIYIPKLRVLKSWKNIHHTFLISYFCEWFRKREIYVTEKTKVKNILTTILYKLQWLTSKIEINQPIIHNLLSLIKDTHKAKVLVLGESAILRVFSISFWAFLLLISNLMLSLFSILSYGFFIFKDLILDFKVTTNLSKPIITMAS